MVNICAKILGSSSSPLSIPSSTNLPNNNASSTIFDVVNTKQEGKSAFLLGCDDFSAGATLVREKLPYFVGAEPAGANGVLPSTYYIDILSAEPIDNITIVFDTVRNNHPLNIIVDYGSSVPVSASTIVIPVEPSTNHTLIFSNWNAVNYPVIIQGISSGIEAEINSYKLLDVNFSGNDRGDYSRASWGIYSNSGTLSFVDDMNIIKTLQSKNGSYKSKLEVFIKNKYHQKLIGTFLITSGDVDTETNVAEITVDDGLKKWQNINVKEKRLLSYNSKGENLYNILFYAIENLVASAEGGISIYFYDAETQRRWEKIWVIYPMIEASSFWAFMVKCCEVSGCYIYCDEKGRAVIKYGGGT